MDATRQERCRERLLAVMGPDVARKATDEFCIAFGSHEAILPGVHAVVEIDAGPWPLPPLDEAVQHFRTSANALQGRELMHAAFGEFGNELLLRRADAALSPLEGLRGIYIAELRRWGLEAALPIRDELARRPPPTPPSGKGVSTRICWLNQTIRTWADPHALAAVAADPRVRRIDVPRTIRPEIGKTRSVVGAVQHHAQFGHTGKGVTVAVIDHEVDLTHPAFQGRVSQTENFTRQKWGKPSPHGTAVAGIIAAKGELHGMAPDAEIQNYKILMTNRKDPAEDFDGALALERALQNRCRIANCSWGTDAVTDGTSREALACDNAWKAGMTVVKSAGNDGPSRNTMTSPADADGVIVVGATNREGRAVQDYSSRGTTKNGKNPHMVAPGGTRGIGARGIESCLGARFGDCGWGTSLAAPHVSGILAVMLEMHPEFTPNKQRERLLELCTPLGAGVEAEGSGLVSIEHLT